MSNRTLLIIGGVAVVGIAGFVAYKVWKSKQSPQAPVPTNHTATGTNSTLPGQFSAWENTIGGLYRGVSGIFSGNSTSNSNNPAPTSSTTTTQPSDLSDWMDYSF